MAILQPPPVQTSVLTGSQFSLAWLRWFQTQVTVINENTTGIRSVSTGGTGKASLTPYAVLAGGITATGVVQQLSLGTATTVLHGNASGVAGFSAVALAVDVSGLLPLANGGGNAALTASLGGMVYSTATALAVLAGTATAGQVLRSGASAAPGWSTATYPATAGAANLALVSDGTNFASTALVNSAVAGTAISVSGATGAVTITNTGVTSAIGTADQVVVSGATGAVTFSLPQSIATVSTPQFARLGLGAAADGTRLLTVADGTTAPGTSIGATIVNYYGTTDANFLGDPAAWLYVRVSGTDRKIPCY